MDYLYYQRIIYFMDIVKASGETELFSEEKLCTSLRRAGAPDDVVHKVCGLVEQNVHQGTTTEQIAKKAQHYLKRENILFAARYNLKKGIMELGPSGFYFEEYVAAILKEYGYAVKVGKIIRGKCLAHEIDILAEKDNKHYIIELKYHNSRGKKTDVQVAMYTYARLLDIAAAHKEFEDKRHIAWVITNTKFTKNAKIYASCMGMELTGWRHPDVGNLETLITDKSLYPVTVLPSANIFVKEQFAAHNLMFVRDILVFSDNDLQHTFGFKPILAKKLLEEAYSLV